MKQEEATQQQEELDEDFKSFRLVLNYYDEDGKHSNKAMTIKVGTAKNISEHYYNLNNKMKYSMRFSIVLPDHIHKYLIGKTIPAREFNSDANRDAMITFDNKLAKTISFPTLEAVCDWYYKYLMAFRWLKQIEKAELKKVIFYNFDNFTDDLRSEWNSKKMGKESQLRFVYSIGYISSMNDKVYRYNENKQMLNEGHEREFFKTKYVIWSADRQLFFDQIQASFETIIGRIDDFEAKINEKSINAIINSKTKLLS